MDSVKRWVHRAYRVLIRETWRAWVPVVGLAGAVAVGRLLGSDSVEQTAYAGALLQVGGLATVALGLHDLRKRFYPEGLRTRLRAAVAAWWRRVVGLFKKRQPLHLNARGAETFSMVPGAELSMRAGYDENDLKGRMTALEKEFEQFKAASNAETQRLAEGVGKLKSKADRERAERIAADEANRSLLEEVTVGGLHLEVVGLVWLLFGVLFGTIPWFFAPYISAIF